MSSVKRTLGHTLVYMLGILANRGIAFLLVPVYTRVLPPSEFAKWDLCTTTILFLLPVFEMGMATALLRFYHLVDSEEERRRVCQSSFTYVTASAVVLSTLMIGLAAPLARAVFGDAEDAALVQLIALTAGVMIVNNQVLALLRAQSRSVLFSVLNVVRAVVGPALIIVLVVRFHWGLAGVLVGDLAGLFGMTAIGVVAGRRYFGILPCPALLKRMLVFGAPLFVVAVASPIINYSDRYFLRLWVGLDETAVYSLGFKIAMLLGLLTQAFQTAWPASAFELDKDRHGSVKMARIFRIMLTGMLGTALMLSLLAPEMVRVFAGSDFYRDARSIIPWICFANVSYMALLYILTVVTIANKTLSISLIVTGGCITKIALNYALIPSLGILGAAASTVVATWVELVPAYLLAQRVRPAPYRLDRVLPFTVVSAGALSASVFAGGLPLIQSASLRVLILVGFAAATLLLRMITPGEVREIGDLAAGLFRRLRVVLLVLAAGVTAHAQEPIALSRPVPARPLLERIRQPVAWCELSALEIAANGEVIGGRVPRLREGSTLVFRLDLHPIGVPGNNPQVTLAIEGSGPIRQQAAAVRTDTWPIGGTITQDVTFPLWRVHCSGDAIVRISHPSAAGGRVEAATLCTFPVFIEPAVIESTLDSGSLAAAFGAKAVRANCWFRLGKGASVTIPVQDIAPSRVAEIGIVSSFGWTGPVRRGDALCRVDAINRDGHNIHVGNLIHGVSTASRDGQIGGFWSRVSPYRDKPASENGEESALHWYVGRLPLPAPTSVKELRLSYTKDVGLIEIADIVLIPSE